MDGEIAFLLKWKSVVSYIGTGRYLPLGRNNRMVVWAFFCFNFIVATEALNKRG